VKKERLKWSSLSSFGFSILLMEAFVSPVSATPKSTPTPSPSVASFSCPEKEYRLDQEGRPLSYAPVLDQDDLGICYASTAALMLQAVDPFHRNFSALELSLQAKKNELLKGSVKYLSGSGKTAESFNESGNTCDAINISPISLCPREFSILENSGLSTYADAVSRGSSTNPFSGSKKTSSSNPFSNESVSGPGDNIFGKDEINVDGPSGSSIDPIAKQAAVLHEVANLMEYLKKEKVANPKLYEELKENAPALLALFKKNVTGQSKPVYSFEKFKLGLGSKLSANTGWEKCTQGELSELKKNITAIANAFSALNGEAHFEAFLQSLSNPNVDLILGAISPACMIPKNRVVLKDKVRCDSINLDNPASLTTPEKQETARKNFGAAILKRLNPNNDPLPVGLRMCSALLKQPSYTPSWKALNNCSANNGDSHFVTIIGARKSKDQKSCEFLVQNSWGAHCESNVHQGCENGKTWIKDTHLLQNSYELDVMTVSRLDSVVTNKKGANE